ncbi:uncharacterized protein LOC114534631 [Dendronephthya gigantea]|uniref:uncharacterized protein LOC114534631 n=1 Tax=Dendronephthya gigantea TaxID=151771 RepID=UPI00106D2101|nr:uncharacterized protein LOC114534631 [Dendronephthya gigantea]
MSFSHLLLTHNNGDKIAPERENCRKPSRRLAAKVLQFKMADEKGKAEGLPSQNYAAVKPPFTADYEVLKGMKVPESITVNSDRNMQHFGEDKPSFQGNQMSVPDKIVWNGVDQNATQVNSNINLQSGGVNLDNYMGGMVTPPRTLTVDDATSRYIDRRVDDKNESRQTGFERLSKNIIEESDNADAISNPRIQGEITRLRERVESLENDMNAKQPSRFWTTIGFWFPIICPIIVHWYFCKRH